MKCISCVLVHLHLNTEKLEERTVNTKAFLKILALSFVWSVWTLWTNIILQFLFVKTNISRLLTGLLNLKAEYDLGICGLWRKEGTSFLQHITKYMSFGYKNEEKQLLIDQYLPEAERYENFLASVRKEIASIITLCKSTQSSPAAI